MREKLEHRKLVMQNMSLRAEAASEDFKNKEEDLGAEVRSLLGAGTAFSAARKRLQVLLIRHHLNYTLLGCPFSEILNFLHVLKDTYFSVFTDFPLELPGACWKVKLLFL